MGKIAIQLYSVREKTSTDFFGTLEKLADMGYEAVQFAGFFDAPATELKSFMERVGLAAAGSHMPFESLTGSKLMESLEYNRIIGNDLIICPILPEEYRKDEEGYYRAAEQLNSIGRVCYENGFTFAYHNHDMEFEDLGNGKTGFDILCEETNQDLVKIELDCYWASYSAVDPNQIITSYQDRIVSLHMKDMAIINGEKRSIELGKGILDFATLRDTGEAVGVRWYVIEQEHFDGDPLDAAKENVMKWSDLVSST